MKISVLTLFPEMFAPVRTSLLGKAADKGIIELEIIDIRQFSTNKHKKCDDYPFGGGDGMVISVQPIFDAVKAVDPEHASMRIYLSPQGKTLTQKMVKELAAEKNLLLLCGHYEGVDQRAIDLCTDTEISIGDYVLTGGEIPAMAIIDAVARYLPGVLHSGTSVEVESFSDNLLEYPQYTRPEDFNGYKVPDVLLSGNHKNIERWRKEKQIEVTRKKRPDLLCNAQIEQSKGKI